ncbi:MAG: AAA family ATPase, partial [Desulfovibrionaceae bacterium]|nr:AAA family ATPase [Desulfovibrionaceae bacterium]
MSKASKKSAADRAAGGAVADSAPERKVRLLQPARFPRSPKSALRGPHMRRAAAYLEGGPSFRELRERHCLLVDKSGLIDELMNDGPAGISLFTRPPGFGRTVNMTMLRDFFDREQESRDLFRGLAIARRHVLCKTWMNSRPVLYLSLKALDGNTEAEVECALRALAADLVRERAFLAESGRVDAALRGDLCAIMAGTADLSVTAGVLGRLVRALHRHWESRVVLLVDDCEGGMSRAESPAAFAMLSGIVRAMIEEACAADGGLEFAVLAGSRSPWGED